MAIGCASDEFLPFFMSVAVGCLLRIREGGKNPYECAPDQRILVTTFERVSLRVEGEGKKGRFREGTLSKALSLVEQDRSRSLFLWLAFLKDGVFYSASFLKGKCVEGTQETKRNGTESPSQDSFKGRVHRGEYSDWAWKSPLSGTLPQPIARWPLSLHSFVSYIPLALVLAPKDALKSSSVAKGESAVSDETGESAETRDALASKEARKSIPYRTKEKQADRRSRSKETDASVDPSADLFSTSFCLVPELGYLVPRLPSGLDAASSGLGSFRTCREKEGVHPKPIGSLSRSDEAPAYGAEEPYADGSPRTRRNPGRGGETPFLAFASPATDEEF
ncbi:hypothetical protein U1Q18_041288 [Sarracenia purpurea var. burkii]